MTHPSKRKGNHYERELVNDAVALGIEAERAYASNGRALGHAEDVDCVIGGQRVQAKRRKTLASFLRPTASVDAVAFREDHGETFILMRWSDWLELLKSDSSPRQMQ